jgi:hypothetical protein
MTNKADKFIIPTNSIYYGKNVIFDNIKGSGVLKPTSTALPSQYNNAINQYNNIDTVLVGSAITLPRQQQTFNLMPSFSITNYSATPFILIVNMTGNYQNDNDSTTYHFFYESQVQYSTGFLNVMYESFRHTDPNASTKQYNLLYSINSDSTLNISIINNYTSTVNWTIKIKMT